LIDPWQDDFLAQIHSPLFGTPGASNPVPELGQANKRDDSVRYGISQ
jgi:hypothetical protein